MNKHTDVLDYCDNIMEIDKSNKNNKMELDEYISFLNDKCEKEMKLIKKAEKKGKKEAIDNNDIIEIPKYNEFSLIVNKNYNMEFKYTVRVEILVIIAIVWAILFGHLCCSCSKVGVKEAFHMAKKAKEAFSNLKKGKKEGFTGANTNNGQSSPYSLTYNKPVNTNSWFTPNLTYRPGSKGKGVQNILNRKKQPVPLPEGELSIFANTPFSPKCCPNSYSNSMGCACMTVDQYNYLSNRGGNNVPYSEY